MSSKHGRHIATVLQRYVTAMSFALHNIRWSLYYVISSRLVKFVDRFIASVVEKYLPAYINNITCIEKHETNTREIKKNATKYIQLPAKIVQNNFRFGSR